MCVALMEQPIQIMVPLRHYICVTSAVEWQIIFLISDTTDMFFKRKIKQTYFGRWIAFIHA